MTYATLLVRLELGRPNKARLAVAAQLATEFDAQVIGFAACQPMPVGSSDTYIPPAILRQDRQFIEEKTAAAEREFRAALEPDRVRGWRSFITFEPPSDIMAREARCADLIITGPSRNHSLLDQSFDFDLGALVLTAGRPCLIVPDDAVGVDLDDVLIAWKDTAEARRAIRDALPLLAHAKHISVLELAEPDGLDTARDDVKEVTAWLGYHGIKAAGVVEEVLDATAQFRARLGDRRSHLIVAGAYGHGRLRELVFGGVTRSLLLKGSHCAFVSH